MTETILNNKLLLAAALTVTLGACNQFAEVTTPPVQALVKNPNVNNARIKGYSEHTIRSFSFKLGEKKTSHGWDSDRKRITEEVLGARCHFSSTEVSLTFTTPAEIIVPKFQGRPTTGTLTCDAPGYVFKQSVAPTLDGVVVGSASVAGLVAAAVSAGVAASKDTWTYAIPRVDLEAVPESD